MFDALLGRAELKTRIEELEDEKHHLERQLDAESERRADAVSDRQDAEARVNRLEDKITELEDRVARSEADTDPGRDVRGTETIRGDRLREILSRLQSVETTAEGALSAAVTDGEQRLPEPVAAAAGDYAPTLRQVAPTLYYTDDAGLVSVCLRPPIMPEPFVRWDRSFRVDPAWFRPTGTVLFGVVRADVCAIGLYENGERRDFEGFESDIKSDHSKGGFSQGRFERIRDQQIETHLNEAAALIERWSHETTADRMILTGERAMLTALSELADHTARTDAGGKPEAALDHAFTDFWTTRLVRL